MTDLINKKEIRHNLIDDIGFTISELKDLLVNRDVLMTIFGSIYGYIPCDSSAEYIQFISCIEEITIKTHDKEKYKQAMRII